MIYTVEFDFENFYAIPTVKIGIDHKIYHDGEVNGLISFEDKLDAGDHTLWIEHYGKNISWTTPKRDHHVFVKRILFDAVNLDQIDYCPITHRGRFYPCYEPAYLQSCREQGIDLPEFICPNHYLGHNGIWKLDFSTPELLWIIKEQNPSGIHLEDTIFSTSTSTLEDVKRFFEL